MQMVCSRCKKIKNDAGQYVDCDLDLVNEDVVSHGICPECAVKIFPELVDKGGKL